MARLLLALLALSAACAPKPYLKGPGVDLFVVGPAGKRQWKILVKFQPKDSYRDAVTIFEEGNPARLPPAVPVAVTKRGFDVSAKHSKASGMASYKLMTVTWVIPEGPCGLIYEESQERNEVYPLLWWGLGEDPGFDRSTPVENWKTLRVLVRGLFPKKTL